MKYLYYKLWQDFTGNVKDNSPAFYSMMWLSVVQSANVLAFLGWLNYYYKIKVFYMNKHDLILYSSVFISFIIAINYFLLFKKRINIANKFKGESMRMKITGTILLYIYMVGSFVLVYIVSQVFPVK
jgi:hypothetical protein